MKTLRSLQWLRPLLVVLFMSYYVGGTTSHYFLTYSITHSHPYLPGTDGLPHHDHRAAGFNTIEELTGLCMELIPDLSVVMALVFLMRVVSWPGKGITLHPVWRAILRAPPCLV